MITSSHQLDEHLDHEWRDMTESVVSDDDLMIQYFYNECRKANQMGLLRYENDVPVLDDYYAYWQRVEQYATTT